MSSYAKSDGARAPIGEGHAPSSSHRTSTPALNGSGVQRSRSQRMTSSGTSASRPAMVRPGSSHQHQSAHRASTGDGAFSTLKPHKSLGDGAAPVESGRFPSVVVPQLSDRFEAEREHLTRASEMPFGPETSDVGLKPPSISSSSSKPSRTASIFRLGRGLRNKSKPSTSAGDSSDAPKEGSASPSARASSSTRSGNSSRSISAVTSAVENTGSSEPRLSISSSRHSGSSPSDGRASSDLDHMLRSGRFASSSSLVAAPSKLKMPQDPEEDGENFAEQIELIHHPGQALVAGSHAVYDSIAGVPSRRHLGSDADQESASAQDDVASAKKGSYVDGSILAEGLGTAKRQHRAVPSIDSNPESTSHGRRRSLALFSMPKQSSSVAGEPDASWEVSQEQSRNRQSANQSASIVDAERTITGRVHAPSIAVASPSSNDYPATSPRILGSFSRRTGVAPPQLPPPAIAPPALPSELARTPNKARQVSAPASTPSRMANLFKSKLMGPRDRVGDEDEGHAAVASLPASSALVGLGTFVMPTRDHEAEERHVEGRRLRKTRSQVNLQGSKASHNSSSRERAIGAGGRDEGQSGSSKGKSTDRSADSARPNHRRPRTSGAADASSRLAPSIAIDGAHETLTASPMDSPTLSSKAWVADERFKAAKEASRAKSGWEMTSSSRLELLDSSPEEEKRQYFPPISPPDSNAPGRRRSFVQRQAPPWRLARANSSTAGVDDYPSGAVNVSRRSSVARPSSAKTLDGAGPSIAAPIGSSAGTSRLDHSGGASALFGGSSASATPRQRASSLIPSLPWTRSRTSSSVALEGRPSLPSGDGRGHSTQQVLNSVASAIAAKDSLQQDAMRRTSIALEHLRSADSDPASTSLQSSTTHVDKYEKPSKASQDSGAREFDSPETFVEHVVASVPRNDVVAVLASKTDDLHKHALQLFMRRFLFAGHPLDIALRKLLMSLCLPKETQQIDRVMEAFAQRYNECNENLFAAQDQPYILAFSLMMLHTDAFNKNAKNKMTKADYVRNTASSKAPVEILEYLYDNLIYAQFIYVENVDDIKRRVSEPVSADGGSGFFSAIGAGGNNASSRVKVDAYAMIAQGRTTELNPDILSLVPEESPFSYTGTADQFDVESLNDAFSRAPSIEIVTQRGPALPTGSSWGGDSPYSSTAMMTTLMLDRAPAHTVSLRVTKVGCVSRKDDLEGGKKAQSRKWRTCGMILTSSQLLFFRDLIWTSALDQQISAQTENHTVPNVVIAPRISFFRPDGVLSLSNAFAVRDITHKKYENVFRLIADQGGQTKQFLFQTPSEAEMNDWIAKINFCGTFRSGGIRMRGLDPAPEDDDDAASVVNRSATFDSSTMSRRPSATPSLDGMTLPGAALPSATPSPTSGTYSGQLGAALSQEASPLSSPSIFGGQSSAGSTPLVGVMRRRVYARRRELKPFIREVTEKLQEKRSELDDNLRLARHFAVLTPFQKVTRDRIEAAAVPLSQKIRELRLEVARHASRRDILLLELVAGDRAARAAGPPSSFVLEPEEHSRSPRLRQSFSSVNATERGIVAPSLELPSMSRSSSNRMAKRVSAGGQGLKIYTSRARDNEEADPSPLGDRSPRTPEWRHSSTGFVAVTPASNANFHSPSSVLATPESATSNRSADSYSFHMRQMEEKPRGIQALSHRSP